MSEQVLANNQHNLLVILIDCNLYQWSLIEDKANTTLFNFDKAIGMLNIFINSYLANKFDNKLGVMANINGKCQFLYTDDNNIESRRSQSSNSDLCPYYKFSKVNLSINSGIRSFLKEFRRAASPTNGVDPKAGSPNAQQQQTDPDSISSSLSKALCFINKFKKQNPLIQYQSRVLILSVSPDVPQHYVSLMNSIFSAQKLNIPIDVCKLNKSESPYLQQASFITNGNYVTIDNLPSGLLQALLMGFLADPVTRSTHIRSLSKDNVDFTAACFCHKKSIEIGHVCSICLSIYCEPKKHCETCGSDFITTEISYFNQLPYDLFKSLNDAANNYNNAGRSNGQPISNSNSNHGHSQQQQQSQSNRVRENA